MALGVELECLVAEFCGLGFEFGGLGELFGGGRVVGGNAVDSVGAGFIVGVGMAGAEGGGLGATVFFVVREDVDFEREGGEVVGVEGEGLVGEGFGAGGFDEEEDAGFGGEGVGVFGVETTGDIGVFEGALEFVGVFRGALGAELEGVAARAVPDGGDGDVREEVAGEGLRVNGVVVHGEEFGEEADAVLIGLVVILAGGVGEVVEGEGGVDELGEGGVGLEGGGEALGGVGACGGDIQRRHSAAGGLVGARDFEVGLGAGDVSEEGVGV